MFQEFNRAFSSATPVAYNPAWANGTGYFDHAVKGVHAPSVKPGDMLGAEDDIGRKIIILGTPKGNVVVFKRYTDVASNHVAYNMPLAVRQFLAPILSMASEQSPEGLEAVLGSRCTRNLGLRLQDLIGATGGQLNPV